MTAGDVVTLRDYSKPIRERHANKVCGPYMYKVPSLHTRGKSRGVGFYCARDRGPLRADRMGSPVDLRIECANTHVTGRLADVSGYYTDAYGDSETLQPIVVRLPHSRGWLAGWTMGRGMCATVAGDVWNNAYDAATEAHRMAERDAELERAYEETQRAELDNDD